MESCKEGKGPSGVLKARKKNTKKKSMNHEKKSSGSKFGGKIDKSLEKVLFLSPSVPFG